MTLNERNAKVESIRKMSEHFSLVSSQLQTKTRSFEILTGMCDRLIDGLESGEEDLNYAGLEKFINNNYKRIIENHGKR